MKPALKQVLAGLPFDSGTLTLDQIKSLSASLADGRTRLAVAQGPRQSLLPHLPRRSFDAAVASLDSEILVEQALELLPDISQTIQETGSLILWVPESLCGAATARLAKAISAFTNFLTKSIAVVDCTGEALGQMLVGACEHDSLSPRHCGSVWKISTAEDALATYAGSKELQSVLAPFGAPQGLVESCYERGAVLLAVSETASETAKLEGLALTLASKTGVWVSRPEAAKAGVETALAMSDATVLEEEETKGKIASAEASFSAFPLDSLPESIRMATHYAAHGKQLNIACYATAAIVTLGAAIGRNFSSREKSGTDISYTNLVAVVAGASGKGKGAFTRILRSANVAQTEIRWAEAKKADEAKIELKKLTRLLNTEIGKLDLDTRASDSEAVKAILEKLKTEQSKLRARRMLIGGSTTGAALCRDLENSDHAIMLFSADGAGALVNALNGRDAVFRELVLSGFSNEPYSRSTATSSNYDGTPCVSCLFAVQPHVLTDEILGGRAGRNAEKLGLLSRLLIVDDSILLQTDGSKDAPLDIGLWENLIEGAIAKRLARVNEYCLEWSTASTAAFDAAEVELRDSVTARFGDTGNILTRARELLLRISTIFAAIEYKDLLSEIDERLVIGQAVAIWRWLMLHKLEALAQRRRGGENRLINLLQTQGGQALRTVLEQTYKVPEMEIHHLLQTRPDLFRSFMGRLGGGKRGPKAEIIELVT